MKKKLLSLLFSFCLVSVFAQSIIVNDPADPETGLSPEELIEQVLIGGACADVTFTNLAENPTGVANLAERSWGYFSDGGTNFPYTQGIILSTGFGVSAEGPNDSTGTSDGGFGWPGDIDIETILNNEYGTTVDTNNATVFEFEIITNLDELGFEFIFASEEYEDQFECNDTFRDGFAFLIKGPGIPDTSGAPFGGINIGSVPGSNNVPVSTASIHSDTFLCGFEVPGTNFFPEFYVSNSGANNTNEVQFDGLTTTLTTADVTVIPGETYTIKLVIADRGDSSFDSAVFLKFGSLNITGVDIGDDLALCDETSATLFAEITGLNPATTTYQWFKDGAILPMETMQSLLVVDDGSYMVEVSSDGCIFSDTANVDFEDTPNSELGPDIQTCLEPDNMVVLDATPTNVDPTTVSYEWSLDGTILPTETGPTLTPTVLGLYSVTVTNNFCAITDTVTLTTSSFTTELGEDIASCFITPETLTANLTVFTPAQVSFEWFLNGIAIPGETNQTLEVNEPGSYQVTATAGLCMATDTIEVTPSDDIDIDLGADIESCFIVPVTLDATPVNYDPTNATFEWSLNGTIIPGETQATLEAIQFGLYEVTVTVGSCEAMDSVTITPGSFTVSLGEDFQTCFEETASITATISDFDLTDATFQWFLNGEEIVGETMASIPVSEEGTYSVIATVGDCTATDEVAVSQSDDIVVTIVEEDFKTCPEETNVLTASTDQENATYQWFKNGELITGETNATLEFTLTQEDSGLQGFSVVITVGDCTAEDDISILLYDVGNCAISQGISPNGDGFNDLLDLEFLSDRTGGINNFKVYNRHGLLVFEQSNYVKEWFGQTDAGDELPTATYYVIMNFNTEDPVYGNQYAAWIYLNRDAN